MVAVTGPPVEVREVRMLPGQASLLANFAATTLAAIAGTGGGKTILGYWWLHSRMETYPGYTWGMAEPTYSLLRRVILESSDPDRPGLEDYFRMVGHHPDYHAVDHILNTDFGKIYLGSADDPDSMQGAAVRGYWLDEAGQMRLLAYETARQRVSMMRGQVLLTTTPYDLGWLPTEEKQKADGRDVAVETWRSIDRPGFPMESYEREKRLLPPWRFAMLYDAQFERPAGLIYNAFNEAVCVIDRFPIPKNWHIYVGHDFGPDNPAALFTAIDPATAFRYRYHEYLPGPGISPFKKVEEWKEITKGYNVIRRVGGAPGEEDARQNYAPYGWPISLPSETIKHVEPQIEKVIALHQMNKIFTFRDMEHYLDEKRTFSRKLDESGQVT